MNPRFILLGAAVLATFACSDNSPLPSPSRPAALRLPRVTRTDLGTLGGDSAQAKDINNLGVVAGWSLTASGDHHAFRWTREAGMLDLGITAGAWSYIHVKDNGKILVNDVLWTPPGVTERLPIPPLPGAPWDMTDVIDFNEAGQFVGSSAGSTTYPFGHYMTWIWTASDGLFDINGHIPVRLFSSSAQAINNAGMVVGNIEQTIPGGFIWSRAGGFVDMGSGDWTTRVEPLGINDLGEVVGGMETSRPLLRRVPFVWTQARGYTVLPTSSKSEGDTIGDAYGISMAGTAVGEVYPYNTFDQGQAVAWPRTGGLLILESAPGSRAVAINDRGTIVGHSGSRAVLWQLGESAGGAQ